jgi:hypothetical protein
MKKMMILVVLVLGLMISPKSAFSQHIEWADIFITPDPATPNTAPVGGFLGGDGNVVPNNVWIDWSVGNCVPWSGIPTDNLVISTCEGDFMSAADWKARMCITKDGNVGIGTTEPKAKLDVNGRILRKGQPFSVTGTATHGAEVTVPWGTTNDWNIFVSPRIMGHEEPGSEGDNALLRIECYASEISSTTWKITARFKWRPWSGGNITGYWVAGNANYILVPK